MSRPHPGKPPSERHPVGYAADPHHPRRSEPPTKIVRFDTVPGRQPREVRETPADLDRLDRDRSLVHFIVDPMRPGAAYFAAYLEHTFFPPCLPARNAVYQVRAVHWSEMLWFVHTIPIDDKAKAEQAANRAELRVIAGTPGAITSEGVAYFPINNPNTHTLENLAGSPLYRGRTSAKLARAIEQEDVEELVAEYERTFREKFLT